MLLRQLCHLADTFWCQTDYWRNVLAQDESLGFWGGSGVETSLRAWLSGGRVLVNKKCWVAHMFRPTFPYKIKRDQMSRNVMMDYWTSRDLPAKFRQKSMDWLVERFAPVPTWHN